MAPNFLLFRTSRNPPVSSGNPELSSPVDIVTYKGFRIIVKEFIRFVLNLELRLVRYACFPVSKVKL